MIKTVDVNNLLEVRKVGLEALKEALGAVGTARFLQQYDKGSGDYSKEKYEQPDLSFEEIEFLLGKHNSC